MKRSRFGSEESRRRRPQVGEEVVGTDPRTRTVAEEKRTRRKEEEEQEDPDLGRRRNVGGEEVEVASSQRKEVSRLRGLGGLSSSSSLSLSLSHTLTQRKVKEVVAVVVKEEREEGEGEEKRERPLGEKKVAEGKGRETVGGEGGESSSGRDSWETCFLVLFSQTKLHLYSL